VFDVIGKRNWFFLFSGLILIPGLIFIALTPISGGKAGLQTATRRQHTIAAVVAKALDQRVARLESPHDFAQRDRLRRSGQTEPAAGTTLRTDETAVGEVTHHFGKMISGDAELGGDLVGRERPRRLAGQPHQGAQCKIRKGSQAHGIPKKIILASNL